MSSLDSAFWTVKFPPRIAICLLLLNIDIAMDADFSDGGGKRHFYVHVPFDSRIYTSALGIHHSLFDSALGFCGKHLRTVEAYRSTQY